MDQRVQLKKVLLDQKSGLSQQILSQGQLHSDVVVVVVIAVCIVHASLVSSQRSSH